MTREQRLRKLTKQRLDEIADEIREHRRFANCGPLNGRPCYCPECGLLCATVPHKLKRFGWLPTYICPLCHPFEVAKLYDALIAKAREEVTDGVPELEAVSCP